MMTNAQEPPVLVTGGSGYLAGFVIAHLLSAGRPVRATIRDLGREAAVRAVLHLHAPTERLSFCAANLLADAGWDAAVEGVAGIIHVASPMPVREYRGQDLEAPARGGVRRVMEAATRAGVGRIVVTSSTAAASPSEPRRADDTTWTDPSRKGLSGYARSKTLAERDAWALAGASGGALALTTILPAMVQGPALGPDVSGSLELPLRMLSGRLPLVPRVSFCGVDVRDAAELHVRALADDSVVGQRVIAATPPLWMKEIAQTLKDRLGARATKVSTREAPDWLVRTMGLMNSDARFLAADLGRRTTYDSTRAEVLLGRRLRSFADVIAAAGESLLQNMANDRTQSLKPA